MHQFLMVEWGSRMEDLTEVAESMEAWGARWITKTKTISFINHNIKKSCRLKLLSTTKFDLITLKNDRLFNR